MRALVQRVSRAAVSVEDDEVAKIGPGLLVLLGVTTSDTEREELAARYRAGGMGYGEAKKMLLAKLDAYFAPFREPSTQNK